MQKLKWHNEKRKVNDLIPFERNPRKMTEEQMDQLKKSIDKFDLAEVPCIDTDNILVAGHMRAKALQLLGRGDEEIDVRVPNRKLTEAEFKEYNVRSNKNTGMFDDELLAALFDEQELRDIGFSDLELGLITFDDDRDETEDDLPEIPIEPVSKDGDLYELGEHRVLCGDSTKKEYVEKLMNGKKADMVFTDPPYNVNYSGSNSKGWDPIMNDKMSDSQFDEFLAQVFQRYAESSNEDAGWYVFHSSSTQAQFQEQIEKAGWRVRTQIIWNKPSATMGWADYRMKHEPMFYCGNEGVKFYGDRTGTSVWDFHKHEDDLLYFVKQLMKADRDGRNTIWTMKREPVADYVHPTQKPVELICYALRNSSKNKDLILDLFLGSGATLIASEKKGRVCYGMELDPKFVDVIVSRYCKYANNYKIKKNGVEIEWTKNEENQTK